MIKLTMKIVKTFFHVYSNSLIPSASYYKKIVTTKFGFSLKYFLSLILTLNLLTVFFLLLQISPLKLYRMFSAVNLSLQKYPEDLNIHIQDGNVTTNYNRPYFVWLDEQDKKHLLAVIDVTATEEKIYEYNTYALITKNEVIFKNALENEKLSRINLSVIQNEVITKQTIDNVRQSILKIKNLLLVLYPLALLVLFTFLFLISAFTTIIYLILVSSLVYLFYLLNVLKHRVTFSRVFQISFHAVTLPLSVNYLLGGIRLSSAILPFVFVLFTMGFTLLGISKAHSYKIQTSTSHHHKKK